jgi:hypothetical protein
MPHGHHVSSAVLVPVTPMFTTAERLALAGFLAGYSGLTPRPTSWTCASMRPGARPATWPCSAPGGRTSSFARDLEPRGWGPRHCHTAAVHHRQVLPVRHQGNSSWITRPPCMSGGRDWTTRSSPSRSPAHRTAIHLAIGEQCEGLVFLAADGRCTPCGTPSSPPRWARASRCGMCRKPLPRRPANHHVLRPGQGITRPTPPTSSPAPPHSRVMVTAPPGQPSPVRRQRQA